MEAYIMYIPAILAIVGLLYMMVKRSWVLKQDAGDGKMKTISEHIYEGALAFLSAEYRLLSIFVVIAAVALYVVSLVVPTTHWLIVPAFIFGAILSAYAGNIGMKIATKTNVRTTQAAKTSLPMALKVAFSGGTVMGVGVASLAVLGLSLVFILMFFHFMGGSWTEGTHTGVEGMTMLLESLAGFSLGAESIALFARVGGGIYTKAADVGADLVGKVEAGIPEDDPRNPATIADNVGDNVGDVAGMGADLFGSYVATVLAAMVLGNYVISDMGGSIEGGAFLGIGPVLLPMMIAGVGIIISIIGTMLVKINSNDAKEAKVQGALNIGNWVSLGLVAVSCYFLVRMLLPETLQMNFFGEGILEIPAMNVFFATLVGLFVGGAISSITEYYTGLGSKPIMKIVEKSSTGAGTNIIAGLATGMISTFPSVILFAGAIWASYALAGFYGVALAASAMMATTAMQLAIDAFGPIADNAGGIAEMSEQPDIVRERTDILDAVGNTTAATGKGFAIASAALTSLALFAAYVTFTGIDGINIFKAPVLAMLFIGGMVPVVFSALAMNAVGKAAMEMVYEVRRQFKEIPGIMEGTGKPEYDKCVAISTKASLKEMVLPGVLTIGMPLLIAFGPMLFGMDYSLIAEMLGGYMAGVTVSGVLWAIFQNNAGGAWDNAKKSFEAGVMINGEMTYKGSDAHTAAITGDTVGDPFKDTSGPSMNILIKLTCLIGLVIAPILGGHGSGNDHSDVNNAGAAAVITAVENQDKSAAQDKSVVQDKSAVQDKNTKPPMQTYNINGERYVLEAESSEMIWRGSKIIGDDHDGTLSFTKGWISVEPNGAIKNGYFEIDMNTLEASIPGDKDAAANLTGHLKDADFFEVEKYPRATLNIGGGSMKDGKVVCKGELKIRDKVKSMKITGSYVEMDGNQIKMTSNIVFDRTDFGVVYKSGSIVQALGDKAIKDEIALESVMVFKK